MPPSVSGFVLVGGKSSRMGRDKALLSWNAGTLAQHQAQTVTEATGSAAFVGDPSIYGHLGYPVYADRMPGHGPLGGIVTALFVAQTDWALILGCDMPLISACELRLLIRETAGTPSRCVVAMGPMGPEPLCGVYHRSCRNMLEQAVAAGRLKMRDIVNELEARFVTGIEPDSFMNLNTPDDVLRATRR